MRARLLVLLLLVCLFVPAMVSAEETVVPRFDINRMLLDGNSILMPDEVAVILKKYTGPQKDFGTIQEAMDELEAAYRKRGYSMVTVILPEQELVRGIITITVIEPTIKEILVEGNTYFSRDNVLRSLPTLKAGGPPNVTAISENLRAANENPSKKLTLQFKAKEKPEELQARIQVKDEKLWKVFLNSDNTGNRQSGDFRVGAGAQYDNLWDLDHVAALQYTSSPTHVRTVKSISGSYRIPFYYWGDTLDLYGGYSDQDSTMGISGLDLKTTGRGTIAGARYTFNMPRHGGFSHKILVGSDYRRYELMNNLSVTTTTVATYPLSMTYGWNWQTVGVSIDGYAGALTNQAWGGESRREQFEAMRNGTIPDYWVFRYGVSSMASLGDDWMLRVLGNGQYSWDRLIPGEQFGLGGSSSVRGYEEREEAWDAGFSGSAEIYSPDLMNLVGVPKMQLRLLGFFDGGYGYNLRPRTTMESANNFLTSIGTGLRVSYGENFSAAVDWGYALQESISGSLVQQQTKAGDSKVHFRVQFTY